jgi:excisionase family DNA binding protein
MDLALTPEPIEFAWPAPVMTVAEVAAVVRVTPKTVRQHIRRGLLRALQLDGTGPYRVRAEDAQRWAERQLVQPDGGALTVDRYLRREADPAVGHATTGRPRWPTGTSWGSTGCWAGWGRPWTPMRSWSGSCGRTACGRSGPGGAEEESHRDRPARPGQAVVCASHVGLAVRGGAELAFPIVTMSGVLAVVELQASRCFTRAPR